MAPSIPAVQVSYSDQSGNLAYQLSLEASPRYDASQSREFSYDPEYNLREIRYEESIRDEIEYQVSAAGRLSASMARCCI